MSLFVVLQLMLAAGAADYWMVDDGREIDRESILFVDKSERLDKRPDGWINFSFYEARNGSRATPAKSMRMTAWANCKTREYINDYRMEYDSGGHMVAQAALNEQQRRVPTPGSAEGRVLAFVCGDTGGATQLPRGTHFIAYADSLYAQGHPQVARAPATPATSPARAPTTGQAADYWLVYPKMEDYVTATVDGDDEFDEIIAFVERSSIVRRPDGWIAFDYVDVRNGSKVKDFKWIRTSTRVNCKTRQSVDGLIRAWTENGTLYGEMEGTNTPEVVEPDSIFERVFKFACGNTADATQLPRGADPVVYADDLYARDHSEPARVPAPRAPAAAPASARPEHAATQGGSKAEMRKQFCDQILQLRSLAPQGFKSILRGPMKDAPGARAVSINLPSADRCLVNLDLYLCKWTLGAATAEPQFRGLGNLLAQCLDVRPDWSRMQAGDWRLLIESAGVSYIFDGLDGKSGFMVLTIGVQPTD